MILKKTIYSFVIFWLISIIGKSQNSSTLHVETQGAEIVHFSYSDVSEGVLNPSDLDLANFRTDTQNIGKAISNAPFKLWVMLDVKFTIGDSNFLLISNALEKSTLFTQNSVGSWQPYVGGFSTRWSDDAFAFPLYNNHEKAQRIFFLIENKTFFLHNLYIGILPQTAFTIKQATFSKQTLPFFAWNIFLISTMFLISFYAFFQFFLNKYLPYLIYGLFAFFLIIGFVQSTLEINWSSYLYNFKTSHAHFEWRLPFMIAHLCQVIFYLIFLNFKPENFKFYKPYVYLMNLQILCVIVYSLLILLQASNKILFVVISFYSLLILFGGLVSIYFIAKERTGRVTYIVLTGTLSLAVCYFVSIFFINSKEGTYPLDRFFFSLGTFIELVFFWISLAVRDRETATEMLRFKSMALSNEIKALRSQMNPHFIFNCLNSLNLYILENHIDAASDYLLRFSKLIRLVLENSRLEHIPLRDEIEALQLYMNLESMRFKEKLSFTIEVDPVIVQDMISVPPLLLQPFIENSIWHGLMHKNKGGTINLRITQPDDKTLRAEIIDDGIGRAAALEMRSKSATLKKSFGMKVTDERIAAINEIYNTQARVEIIDLYDDNKKAKGTKVIVNIPI